MIRTRHFIQIPQNSMEKERVRWHMDLYEGLFGDYFRVMDTIILSCTSESNMQVRRDQIFAKLPDLSKKRINYIIQHLKETGRIYEPFLAIFKVLS